MPVGRPRTKHPVIVVVWCGQCTTAHHKNRGRLGHIERWPTGRVWVSAANTGAKSAWGKIRRAPMASFLDPKRGEPPARLHASCPRHGIGSLAASDVIESRGSVVLDLNTARA